jgi:transcriptional regulator with XRE-family HTH domain
MYRFNHDRVRKLRDSLGLTQEQLAMEIDSHQHIISKIENAKTKEPTIWTLWRLSRFFKVPMESFMEMDAKI